MRARRSGCGWRRRLAGLPAIAAAFGEGRLSWDQVRALATLATPDTDAVLAQEAPGHSAAQLQAAARRARSVSEAQEAEAQRRRSLRWRFDHERGWLRLWGRLAHADGALVVAALERGAARAPSDPDAVELETYECRAADALVELAGLRLGADADPERATVVVHVDASALAGGPGSAALEHGPALATSTLERLACDARIQVVAEDQRGQALRVGRATLQVPAWLARQLRHRDGGCRFPGCGRTRWVQAHHIRHWSKGGPTDAANLVLLCGYHHRVVHQGWALTGHPGATLSFTRADGQRLATHPPPLRPETKARLQPLLA